MVTGGGTGLGRAIAEALGEGSGEGGAVSLIGRRIEPLRAVASGLPQAEGFTADVTDQRSLEAAHAEAVARFGPVTTLIAAAGASDTAPVARTEPELLRRLFAVNVEGVLNAVRLVLPEMLTARTGRIVAIASTAALKGYAYAGAYAATKHAVLGLIRSLALETARSGVTANAVCPGFADTEMTGQSIERIVERTGRSAEEARAALASTNPMGRLVDPHEVADAVRWLVGPSASAITGQAIVVAGGEVM